MKTRREIIPEIDRAVFRVITDADWQRELRVARIAKNELRDRIQKILAQKQFKTEGNKHGTDR